MKYLLSIIALLSILINANLSAQTNWKIDQSHSKISFSVTHLLISEVDGFFNKYEGKLISNGDNFENSQVEIKIDVNSISTDNEKRDQHLKSDDFFNAEKFPNITFKSTSFKKTGKNTYKMVGDFTIRDVTKKVTFDVVHTGNIKDSWGNQRAGFKISGQINRFDYNLKWNNMLETGGAVVSKEVDITCKVELIKN